MISRLVLLGAFGVLVSDIVHAQPVLQANAYGHVSTDLYSMPAVPSAVAANGEAITWDISAYPISQFASLERILPAVTPYAPAFPNANWSEHVEHGSGYNGYNYYNLTDTSLQLIGFSPFGSISDTGYYLEPYLMLQFPLQYEQEFTSTAHLEGGIPLLYRWRYSGYGTLITPLAVFTNVVKLENLNNPGMLSFWSTDPLVEVLSYGNFTFFNLQIPVLNTGREEAKASLAEINLMIETDMLFVSSEMPIASFRIMDQLGRIVRSKDGMNTLRMSEYLNDLSSGTYIVQIVTERGIHSQRIFKSASRR